MPMECLVDWTTANGPGKVSVLFFNEATSPSDMRDAVGSFLTDADGVLSTTTSWVVRTTGRVLDDATGTLTGSWTQTTGHSGLGAQAFEQGADATQILVRWKTGNIVNGRFVQGRTFLPGVASTAFVDGNLSDGARDTVLTAATNLAEDPAGFGVWHRPVDGAGGVFAPATAADVWSEFAVLRRRRG